MIGVGDLGALFKQGANRGVASNMTIIEGKHFTYLVDYGWAVLAKRSKASGRIIYYSGWDGFSRTTSKHISQAGLRSGTIVKRERKKLSDVL